MTYILYTLVAFHTFNAGVFLYLHLRSRYPSTGTRLFGSLLCILFAATAVILWQVAQQI